MPINSQTQLYTVIKNFTARLPDELTIKEGDLIDLISDDSEFDDGWYMGKNLSTGKVGLYPKVFTKIKRNSNDLSSLNSKPSLLRSRSRRTPQSSPITPTANSYFGNYNDSQSSLTRNITPEINQNGVNRYVNDIDNALKELNVDPKNSPYPNSPNTFNNNNNNNNNNISNNTLNTSNVANWTPQQVSQYFSSLIDSESANKFIIHKISGAILLELELSYLKELDISSFGTRFEIYKEIESLRKSAENAKQIPVYVQNDIDVSQPINYLEQSVINDISSSTAIGTNEIDNDSHKLAESITTPKTQSFAESPSVERLSYNDMQRPQSVVEKSNRFSRSSPSPLQFNYSTESAFQSQNNTNETNEESKALNVPLEASQSNEQFLSPRKAPKPPNYPSPVSNNPTKFGIRSPIDESSPIPKLSHRAHSRHSSLGNASSIYVDTSPIIYTRGHSRTASEISNLDTVRSNHRRYSSVIIHNPTNKNNATSSTPTKSKYRSQQTQIPSTLVNPVPLPSSPERRSVSAKEFAKIVKSKDLTKRIQSDALAAASAASASASAASASSNLPSTSKSQLRSTDNNTSPTPNSKSATFKQKMVRRPSKMQTSAFQEGIQNITPDEAIKEADYSGWMFKKGNMSIGSWKHRFFTLHKTRLSYYATTKDTKEKGLIDITAHRVLPATEAEDKLSAVYAATAGYGRYCFKLVPPAPGSRKGLTFTQQKVHYFAVETKEEMRSWMSALMKVTIELDETVPAISSCVTPTIPLQKAQELMAVARENAKENFDNLQKMREEQLFGKGFDNVEGFKDPSLIFGESGNKGSSYDEEDTSHITPSGIPGSATPSSTGSSVKKPMRVSSGTNSKAGSPFNGMSTPYLLTSGMASSSASAPVSVDSPARMASTKVYAPTVTRLDDDDDDDPPQPPSLSNSNSFSRRMMSLRRVSKDKEKSDEK